ncbi:MAG: LON peptidase substrate-binding domain-containing protein, partial [Clostridia bacterium]|nr:LON peptidase substrate-binding domain-containing protein [Clostridia bacterium]
MAKLQEFPLLALRGRVVFPNTTVNFDIGRMISLTAVKFASDHDSRLIVCAQKQADKEDITEDDVYTVGTVVKLRQITRLPGNNIRLSVEGLFRAVVKQVNREEGAFIATVEELPPVHGDQSLEEAYFRTSREILKEITSAESRFSKDAAANLDRCTDPDEFVNLAAHYLQMKTERKQEILECTRVVDRLRICDKLLNEELEIMRLERKINAAVRQNIDQNQKEYYLREQLKAIHAELGDDAEETDELREKIINKKLPKEVEEKALKELSRMSRMQTSSPDYNVLRIYLDWLLDLPWDNATEDTKKLADAVKILNADHYGLEKIKERITEYLAVLKRTDGMNAPILCFVGPPGVGKTSIAGSIARSLGRKFVRMSLGGVKDEAEIRGHRKTYVGAMPGRIINGMKKAGAINPVFLLDEVD